MSKLSFPARETELLAKLARISAERAEAEERTSNEFTKAVADRNRAHAAERHKLDSEFSARVRNAEATRDQLRDAARERYESEKNRLKKEFETGVRTNESTYIGGTDKAKKKYDEAKWQVFAVFESAKENARKELEDDKRKLAQEVETAQAIREEGEFLLHAQRSLIPAAPESGPPSTEAPEADPRPLHQAAVTTLDENVHRFGKLTILKLIKIDVYLMLQVLIAAIVAYPFHAMLGLPAGAIAGGVFLVVEAIALYILLRRVARRKATEAAGPLRQSIAETLRLEAASAAWLDDRYKKVMQRNEAKRDKDLESALDWVGKRRAELEKNHSEEKIRLETHYPPLLAQAKTEASEMIARIESSASQEIAEATKRHADGIAQCDATHERLTKEIHARRDAAWNALFAAWKQGTDEVRAEIEAIRDESSRLFPDWHEWTRETAATETPPGVRFGEFKVEVDRIADALPENHELAALAVTDFSLPAVVAWHEKGSLLIRASDEGRDEAVSVLQQAMTRLLTAFPPSKARFTIIDPIGLGQNFASFMHLADHDELLINHRIWTDPQQIDQRLTDLTDHMENVIQTYLRNDYATIEDYNAQAGEVAEPFRFLVVANFPHGFSEIAIRKLVSIAKSGARCGVHLLMSIDMEQPMPFGFSLKELEPHATVLLHKDGGFVWRDNRFEHYPLTVDQPPPIDAAGPLLSRVGAAAKAARRVEVPFEVVAPRPEALWSETTINGVQVPLGRAGATKLQYLSLGKGTSQHVLIAGKTGSGKSTFLHALITNVALRYSPDEIELYLIDFKKGVEFKTYASHELPHARVVAVESEREFGLSVLQRLDAELKNRGDRYRKVGAQDVAGYRAATGEALPRILLLVDEFQEFFVEDDKLAQEASLLLDRLVRQGRAFGIHVHLGSQTLGGAYSIARSTLGQMAVRIALQCSESDAHLILSEENTAARLLSRPGEAIYNDANGLVEGNHIFQIVWLNESLRETYLQRLKELAIERGMGRRPMIVFEGNTPAELERSVFLGEQLSGPDWPAPKRSVSAWLGDAIAIKDPTAAVFQPQSGNHMLIIGQQEESALGVMSGTIAALAAQHAPDAVKFVLFDGTPSDSPNARVLSSVVDVLPHEVERGTTRSLARIIGEIHDEVERRRQDESLEPMPLYLFIHDLNRFRELRKKDDDFGFGSYGSDSGTASPSKQFGTILREGPMVNVHVIVWCDTVNNLNRTFDRSILSEFEMRVLFQMSANDSSNLIDTPAAGKLGTNRAYFHSEEQGRLEKFRPYGLPSPEFLALLGSSLAAKPKRERPTPPPREEEPREMVEDAV